MRKGEPPHFLLYSFTLSRYPFTIYPIYKNIKPYAGLLIQICGSPSLVCAGLSPVCAGLASVYVRDLLPCVCGPRSNVCAGLASVCVRDSLPCMASLPCVCGSLSLVCAGLSPVCVRVSLPCVCGPRSRVCAGLRLAPVCVRASLPCMCGILLSALCTTKLNYLPPSLCPSADKANWPNSSRPSPPPPPRISLERVATRLDPGLGLTLAPHALSR